MPSEVIGRGKSTEEAIENALKELGVKREDVEVLPLQAARKGFLGIFGGQDAEVRVRLRGYRPPEEKPSAETRERQPRRDEGRPNAGRQSAPAPSQSPAPDRRNARDNRPAPPRREPPPPRPQPARQNREPRESSPDAPPRSERVLDNKNLLEITTEILKLMGVEAEVSVQEEGSTTRVIIRGAGGILIGRRGQTLNSFQYLLGRIMSDSLPERQKVVVDIDDYRERREDTLVSMAKELADKAVASGREQVLPPMDARDRRVIHLYLREIRGVETVSRGTGNFKRVIIVPKGARRPPREGRERDGDRGRGRRSGRGFSGRGRGDRDRNRGERRDRPDSAGDAAETQQQQPQTQTQTQLQPSREDAPPVQE